MCNFLSAELAAANWPGEVVCGRVIWGNGLWGCFKEKFLDWKY